MGGLLGSLLAAVSAKELCENAAVAIIEQMAKPIHDVARGWLNTQALRCFESMRAPD
jgi:hypothetical protein